MLARYKQAEKVAIAGGSHPFSAKVVYVQRSENAERGPTGFVPFPGLLFRWKQARNTHLKLVRQKDTYDVSQNTHSGTSPAALQQYVHQPVSQHGDAGSLYGGKVLLD